MSLSPRDSAALVSRLSKHVTINPTGVEKAANLILDGFQRDNYAIGTWKHHKLHPDSEDAPFAINWIFLVDTLNFSFWAEEPGKQYTVTFEGETYTGYWSLCAAINRALKDGIDITSPHYYSKVSLATLKAIFRSDSDVSLPLLEERWKILNETGKCLIEKYDGSFVKCISLCENSAQKLLSIIVENFSSYKDEATIDGHIVSFYKRAQILIGDIWSCFEGEGFGTFEDIDNITMFADYRIPQVLAYLGVLEYSDELMKRLKEGELLKNGDMLEVEIRGCTIWAVELIYQHLQEKKCDSGKFNVILIDNYLWDYRRANAKEIEHIPFHKTRCIYY